MYAVPLSPTGSLAYGGAVNHSMPDLGLTSTLFPYLVQYLGHWRHGYRTTALLFSLAYLDGDMLSQFYQYCLYYWPMLDEDERNLVRRIELKLGGYAGMSLEAMQAIAPIAGFGMAIEDGARMQYGLPTHGDYSGLGCAPCGVGSGHGRAWGGYPYGCGCGCGCDGQGGCGQGQQTVGASPRHVQPRASSRMGLRNQGAGFGYSMRGDSPYNGGYGPYNTVGADDDAGDLFDGLLVDDGSTPNKGGSSSTPPPKEKPFDWAGAGKIVSELAKVGIDIGKQIASATGAVSPSECMANPKDPRCATMKLPDNAMWRNFCNTPMGRVFQPCINAGFVTQVPPVPPGSGAATDAAGMKLDTNTMLMMGVGLLALLAIGFTFMRGV